MSILTEIFAHKKTEVERQLQVRPLAELRRRAESAPPPLDFVSALHPGHAPALIAELKRASPSKNVLLGNFEAVHLAGIYIANGANAISILTDWRYFQGDMYDLVDVRQHLPSIPLLRKDFIYHPYQVYESRSAGADALLLIVAGLDRLQLAELHSLINELGMAALVEVHNQDELEIALSLQPRLVGINNRDLHTFNIDLETTMRLAQYIPPGIRIVSESGIKTAGEVSRLARSGIHAILVGEALVTAPDPAAKVRELAGLPAADSSPSGSNPGRYDS